jgi:hypothetical protein
VTSAEIDAPAARRLLRAAIVCRRRALVLQALGAAATPRRAIPQQVRKFRRRTRKGRTAPPTTGDPDHKLKVPEVSRPGAFVSSRMPGPGEAMTRAQM